MVDTADPHGPLSLSLRRGVGPPFRRERKGHLLVLQVRCCPDGSARARGPDFGYHHPPIIYRAVF